jgi:hypothetical protein
MALDPGREVARRMRWLRATHWIIGSRARFPLAALGFLLVSECIPAGWPTYVTDALPPAALGSLLAMQRWHGKLQPWCPWCRPGGDGDGGERDPEPSGGHTMPLPA